MLLAVWRHLFQQPLPGLLILAEAFFQIFQNPLEVGVGAEIVPRWILLEPGIVFVA